jgi:cytoskeleton protein RodZ
MIAIHMIGSNLKKTREQKQITLEQVAQGTNIRIQFLQAIEDDRLEVLPSPAQARGFIRLYASFLGLDSHTLFETQIREEPPVTDNEEPKTGNVVLPVQNPGKQKRKKIESSLIKILEPGTEEPKKRFKDLIPQSDKVKLSSMIFAEIGDELKKQRESLGISLTDAERLTKIRELYLFNLERGLIDNLPSTVQGRGMLNNYATFLSIDPTALQTKFAEGLLQKRLENVAIEFTTPSSKKQEFKKSPITGWRRFLTLDLLVGVSVFSILFVLVIWGAIQVIGTSRASTQPTLNSISDILVNTVPAEGESTSSEPIDATPSFVPSIQAVNTTSVDILATITSVSAGPIQLVIVGYQRSYLKVISDGTEVFNGRVVPGNVYTFTGSVKVTLDTGNAAGIQVYFNQVDLGILGMTGQVVSLEFTKRGVVTPTPRFTASPTITQPATLTPLPTNTPRPTPTIPTVTITPLKP